MTDTALPPWKPHWLNTAITIATLGRDSVLRSADGFFYADLDLGGGNSKQHGPFATAEECLPCIASRCECWRRK